MYEAELSLAKKLALEAGEVMLNYFDRDQEEETKKDGSPVTIADKKINSLVIERIKSEYTNDKVVGEEESYTPPAKTSRHWYCDPIDGTKPFVWGLPTSMFSLALVVDDNPVMGVIYDPFLKRLLTSIKGNGSFLNDEQIFVSKETSENGTVAVSGNFSDLSKHPSYAQSLADKGIKMVSFNGWAYKASLVATGRLIGLIDRDAVNYDLAATHIILEEAGGKATDLKGNPLSYEAGFKGAVVSNGLVHKELLTTLS